MNATPVFNCAETFRRLQDFLDRRLTPAERSAVEVHLMECLVCAGEYRFEGKVIEEIRAALSRLDVPPQLFRKVQERLEAARQGS
jgi:anti-sigma factor (TIGR02949 family)